MKKISLLTIAVVLPFLSYAADFPWLTFLMADNTELSVAADNLAIDYSDGYLHLSSDVVNQSVAVSMIRSMQFTQHSSGIESVDIVNVGNAEYFTTSGKSMGRFATPDQAREALPSGIYIAISGDKTIKIIF